MNRDNEAAFEGRYFEMESAIYNAKSAAERMECPEKVMIENLNAAVTLLKEISSVIMTIYAQRQTEVH